jgi:hypothetical protein
MLSRHPRHRVSPSGEPDDRLQRGSSTPQRLDSFAEALEYQVTRFRG